MPQSIMFECDNTNVTAVTNKIETQFTSSLDSSLNSIVLSNEDSFDSHFRLDSLKECEEYFNSAGAKEPVSENSPKLDLICSMTSEADISDISNSNQPAFILPLPVDQYNGECFSKKTECASLSNKPETFSPQNPNVKADCYDVSNSIMKKFKPYDYFNNEDTFVLNSLSDREHSEIESQKENINILEDCHDTFRRQTVKSYKHYQSNAKTYLKEHKKDIHNDKVYSGFTNGNNKKIMIDPSKIKTEDNLELFSNKLYDKYLDQNGNQNEIDSGFTTGNKKKILIDKNKVDNTVFENFANEFSLVTSKQMTVDEMDDSALITCQNDPIFLDKAKIQEEMLDYLGESNTNKIDGIDKDASCSLSSQTTNKVSYLQSDFVTGNNKKISIDPSKIQEQIYSNELNIVSDGKQINAVKIENSKKEMTHREKDIEASNEYDFKDDIKHNKFSKHQPIRRYNIPEKGHISKKYKEDHRLGEIYKKVKNHYRKEEPEWIFNNFKWTWMHLYVNNQTESDDALDRVLEIMQFKKKNERSILRRIVEGDDISVKFMTLGILNYNQRVALLFDGSYSLLVEIDKSIYTLLRKNNCTTGSKVYVFGSKLLLKEPTSIFDITVDEIEFDEPLNSNCKEKKPGSFTEDNDIYKSRCALKLFFNSVSIAPAEAPLGLNKKISFLNTIRSLSMTGGIISALVVRVKKVVEFSYLVVYENYRNRTKNLEEEIEKIASIADKTGNAFDPQSVKSKYYCKLLVEDESGECLLTWWSPPEVKENDRYKLVYLKPVEGALGKHVTTVSQTFFEKI